jgi:regulator of cell morphogenesis and NO signaling
VTDEIEKAVLLQDSQPSDLNSLSLPELIDYIVSTHHAFTKKELPQIYSYLQKVSSKHGDRHSELHVVLENFTTLKEELELHMQKEELILFPRIKGLENSNRQNTPGMNIEAPVTMMEDEHEHAGHLLQVIRQYTNNYTAPADACTTYRLSFAALEALEKDLHQHIHLENNVLFPKAIRLFNSIHQVQ